MFAQKSSCSIYVIGNRPRAVKSCESIDSKFRSLTRKLFSNFSISSLNQNRTTFSLFMPCFSVHDFYRSDAISADKCLSSRNLLAAFSKVEKAPQIDRCFSISKQSAIANKISDRRHAALELSVRLQQQFYQAPYRRNILLLNNFEICRILCRFFSREKKENSESHDLAQRRKNLLKN